MNNKKVINNIMQKGYIYSLTRDIWDFSDFPQFNPDLTPYEMLEYGVFWWKYFWDIPGTWEYPKDFEDLIKKVSVWINNKSDEQKNYFKIDASQSLEEWNKKGWIEEQDPRGWFEWYTRFYFGRRSNDDIRQIKRWNNITRFLTQVKNNCKIWEHNCKTKLRQLLLHWSYDTIKKY